MGLSDELDRHQRGPSTGQRQHRFVIPSTSPRMTQPVLEAWAASVIADPSKVVLDEHGEVSCPCCGVGWLPNDDPEDGIAPHVIAGASWCDRERWGQLIGGDGFGAGSLQDLRSRGVVPLRPEEETPEARLDFLEDALADAFAILGSRIGGDTYGRLQQAVEARRRRS